MVAAFALFLGGRIAPSPLWGGGVVGGGPRLPPRRRRDRDDDARGAQDAVVQQVARLQHLHDRLGRVVLRRLLHDGLVPVGVERLALGIDARDTVPAQGVEQLGLYHDHALRQGAV